VWVALNGAQKTNKPTIDKTDCNPQIVAGQYLSDTPARGATDGNARTCHATTIRAAVRGHGLQSTFELVMNTLSEVVSCDCGVLLSWQVGERTVRVDALSGGHQTGLQAGMDLPVSEAVPDLVCGRLAAVICSDTHIGCDWLNRTMGQMGIGSSLMIALDSDSPAQRLLLIGSIKREQFNSEDAATVGELAGALRASLQHYWQDSDQEIGDQWGRGDAGVREHHRLVSELSQGVAHRLSNTFAVLLGKLQLLEDKINNQETVEQLRELQATVIEGTTILQSLTRFSASEQSNSREIVNLRTLAQEVIDLTRPAWDSPNPRARVIKLIHHTVDDIEVYANRAELKEALINIVFNAIQALPAGGEIVITQGCDDGLGFVEVADSGVGMDGEVRRRATEPFFTTRNGDCPGLGLSLASRIARKHDGYVSIFSEPGEGSVIRLSVASLPEADVP